MLKKKVLSKANPANVMRKTLAKEVAKAEEKKILKKPVAKKSTTIPPVTSLIPDELKTFCVPINTVRPWEDNPRKNDDAAEKLAELIKANGFRKPIVIDQNNIVRAGNTTLKAMKLLKSPVIPVIKHIFPSDAAAVAFAISDNKASEFAEWDPDVLKKLMKSDSLQGTGFSEVEFKKMFIDKKMIEDSVRMLREVIVSFGDNEETEMQKLFEELTERGLNVKVVII
jgi:DNA-binding transcriptional regulator YiaG